MLLVDTYLNKSQIHGIGVFSKENIKQKEIVTKELPQFEFHFNQNELPKMPLSFANFINKYAFESNLDKNILILGIDNEKYINHSDEPNIDEHGYAIKNIKIDDELTVDYRKIDRNYGR
jgi:SET domain-containing protein